MDLPFKGLFTKQNVITYGGVALAFLVIALIMNWTVTFSPTNTVLGTGGDPFQDLWNLWWVPYATFVLHTNLYFSPLLYWPIGASLVTQTMAPLAGILFYPFQAVSLAFELNVITMLSYALGGLFMFILAHRFTQNKQAAFLAGMVFAFSAMHVVQTYGHIEMTSIEFIPLFLIFFIDLIKKHQPRHAIYSAIAFTLVVFIGGLQYALMVIMLIVFIIIYELLVERHNILNRRFPMLFALMLVLIFVIGSPGYLALLHGIENGALSYVNAQGGTSYNELYSIDVASYFLPSFTNGFFHDLSNYYYVIFAPDPGERPAYIGYSVLLLVIIAIAADWKDHRLKLKGTRPWLAMVLIFGWLTLGPVVQIGGLLTGIPAIYAVYHLIPIFNVIREPGRFDIIVTLGLAMLAAIGFDRATKSERIKKIVADKNKLFTLFFVVLLIEYWGGPFPGAYARSTVSNTQIPPAYYEIGNQTGTFALLLLPALSNGSVSPNLYPGIATYYQTAFRKPLVGGYTVRENYSEAESVLLIPLSQEAAYVESGGNQTVFLYPIIENYSNLTAMLLSIYGVKYVGVIRSAYTAQGQETLLSYLQSVFGKEVYQDPNTTIFSTQAELQRNISNNILAYTVGTWLPGLELCQNPELCPVNFGNTWWGDSQRAIEVYAPSNSTHVTMSMSAYSFTGQRSLEIYASGEPQTVLQLNTTPANYTVHMILSPGFNQVFFLTANSTNPAQPVSEFENFGVRNIYFYKT